MDPVEKVLLAAMVVIAISALGLGIARNVRVGTPSQPVAMPNAEQQSWKQPNVEANPQPYGPSNHCNGPDCPW